MSSGRPTGGNRSIGMGRAECCRNRHEAQRPFVDHISLKMRYSLRYVISGRATRRAGEREVLHEI